MSQGFTTPLPIPLPLNKGGTNAALTAANGAIPYSTSTAFALLAAGTLGQLFQSGGAGAPTWTTATFPATAGTSGNVLTSNGTNFVSSAPLLSKAGYLTFTRDISTATGTQAVTGLGFTPKMLVIFGNVNGSTAGYTSFGMGGVSGSTGTGCVFVSTTWNDSATNIISLIDSTGVNQAVATVQSLDSDGFTLSWTKTASPTGTARMFAFCVG